MVNTLRHMAFLLAPALLALLSCEAPTAPEAEAPRIESLPRALTTVESAALLASNDFGFRLLREVQLDTPPRSNVFLSPLSVSMALGMAANGARGETLEQTRSALGLEGMTREEMNQAYRGLLDLLPPLDPRVELGIANSAWLNTKLPPLPSFVNRVRTSFAAEVDALDFQDGSRVVDRVNGWVKDRTHGRIDQVLDSVKKDDFLYLVNAIYFKGSWRSRFDPSETRPASFVREDGSTVEIPLMSQDGMGGLYFEGGGVRIADLPFGGDAYSIVVVVPTSGTLTELLAHLTPERWNAWMAALQPNAYRVQMPRFQLEYAARLDSALMRMGMVLPFKEADADFTDMLIGQYVWIDQVKHKSFLGVDEEGAEAAAVTFVGMQAMCGGCTPTFTVDRPFMVAIRERLSGALVFLGAVYDPS